jgi:hypothetical protein
LLALAFTYAPRAVASTTKHELMTISLVMFALGSLALWAGATLGWGEWTYKAFYLFGAVLNVPFLALGTVYLLGDERTADRITAVVSLLAAFAAGIVVAAPIVGTFDPAVLPQGSAVFGPGPRIAAALGSGVASLVILGGALYSAARLFRAWRAGAAAARPGAVSPGRLALANLVIAAGTLVLGSGGTLNSVADAMDAFAISLVVGIALIFGGFLLTSAPTPPAEVEPWYPPARSDARAAEDATGAMAAIPGAESRTPPPPAPTGTGADDHPSAPRPVGRGLADTAPGSPHLN